MFGRARSGRALRGRSRSFRPIDACHASRNQEVAVAAHDQHVRCRHRDAVEWAIEVWKLLAAHRLETNRRGQSLGVELEEHEVGTAAVERMGDAKPLRFGGEMDEAFGVEGQGAIRLLASGGTPRLALGDVKERQRSTQGEPVGEPTALAIE